MLYGSDVAIIAIIEWDWEVDFRDFVSVALNVVLKQYFTATF